MRAEEFMASGSESSSFEMSFRMKMRWGLTDTTWRRRETLTDAVFGCVDVDGLSLDWWFV